MDATLPKPDPSALIAPILPALPPAAAASEPAPGVLSLLSPILRQRVQLLSASSSEPWLRLLCYDTAKAAKLVEVAQGGAFEPHPISGEVEVDWDYDAEMRYRRMDEETLQALLVVDMLGLAFQLVYCVGDTAGGGDGWRIGEVTIPEKPLPFGTFQGVPTIAEAERTFEDSNSRTKSSRVNGQPSVHEPASQAALQAAPYPTERDDEDDDGYWDRYDATPARTPATKRSPAPRSLAGAQPSATRTPLTQDASDEADYFAQYDDVQPAMDNHDPDEAAQIAHVMPDLDLEQERDNGHAAMPNGTNGSWAPTNADGAGSPEHENLGAQILHPRPESSASSTGEQTVAKLEELADRRDQNEFSVKKHVSRSIRSLWLLSRGAGISRDEFEEMVKTELDVLGMIEDLD